MNKMDKESLVELWLEAEEENRKDNSAKCLELKEKFSQEYNKLSLEDKEFVRDELESLGA
jgi:hypothetical protein